MHRFAREFGIASGTRVLDIGGTAECWRLLAVQPRLVLLNLPQSIEPAVGAELRVAGDGRMLPFRDGAFDVVFSNSAIEHVGGWASQQASRARRRAWDAPTGCKPPTAGFHVEQHLFTPFIHWLPKDWQRAIVPRCNFWRFLSRVTPDRRQFYIHHFLRDIRLLGPGRAARLVSGRAPDPGALLRDYQVIDRDGLKVA